MFEKFLRFFINNSRMNYTLFVLVFAIGVVSYIKTPKEIFPEGLPIFIHFDGFSGEIYEMNFVINYIGREPIWLSGQWERERFCRLV